MERDARIERAIAIWRLRSEPHFGFVRFYPPEHFLSGHGAIGQLSSVTASPGEPRLAADSVVRVACAEDVAPLSRVGAEGGPPLEAAMMLLRRARGTPYECDATDALLIARGPIPVPLRIEGAYLLAANGLPELALAFLEKRTNGERVPKLLVTSGEPVPVTRWTSPPEAQSLRKVVRAAESWSRRAVRAQPVARAPRPPKADGRVPTTVSETDIDRLADAGLPHGPHVDEILSLLHRTRGTGQGIRALRTVVAAKRNAPLPETVRALCAELMAERGIRGDAFELLVEGTRPPPVPSPPSPGIDVDATLRDAEAEARAASAERVLAADVDRLGVRERHTRFQAVARAATLTVDAFRKLGGHPKDDAARDAARELERIGEQGRAAELYALGGAHGEARRVGVPARQPVPQATHARSALEAIDALDRRGLRLSAIEAARAFLQDHPDAEVAAFARGVVARLAVGPIVALLIDGEEHRVALGDTITIGRVGTITVASPLVSRAHLEIRRVDGVPVVEDRQSHNGTWLAGARIRERLPIGEGFELDLGRGIPCSLRVRPLGVAIDVAGEQVVAPLGPLVIGDLKLSLATRDEGPIVMLEVLHDASATLAAATEDATQLAIETVIELALGDVVRVFGDAPRELRVLRDNSPTASTP